MFKNLKIGFIEHVLNYHGRSQKFYIFELQKP